MHSPESIPNTLILFGWVAMLLGGWYLVFASSGAIDKKYGHQKSRIYYGLILLGIWIVSLSPLVVLDWLSYLKFGLIGFIIGATYGYIDHYFGRTHSKIMLQQSTQTTIGDRSKTEAYWAKSTLVLQPHQFISHLVDAVNQRNPSLLNDVATPELIAFYSLSLQSLAEMENAVQTSRSVSNIELLDTSNDTDSTEWYRVGLRVSQNDKITDSSGKTIDDSGAYDVQATWKFVRRGDNWLLDTMQTDFDTLSRNTYTAQDNAALQFATQNNFAYSELSENWLLPAGSYVLPNGKTDVSVVLDDVIGTIRGRTFHIYNIIGTLPGTNGKDFNYTVCQLSLPRAYDNILVTPNKYVFFDIQLHSQEKITTEWPQFNDIYSVYAQRSDQVSALELLNPEFMSYLYDTNQAVTINVFGRSLLFILQNADRRIDIDTNLYQLAERAAKELAL